MTFYLRSCEESTTACTIDVSRQKNTMETVRTVAKWQVERTERGLRRNKNSSSARKKNILMQKKKKKTQSNLSEIIIFLQKKNPYVKIFYIKGNFFFKSFCNFFPPHFSFRGFKCTFYVWNSLENLRLRASTRENQIYELLDEVENENEKKNCEISI